MGKKIRNQYVCGAILILFAGVNILAFVVMDTRIHFSVDRCITGLRKVNDPASSDIRFSAIKKILPDHGTVGYITDIENNDIMYHVNSSSAYYEAQYALAPIVVTNSLLFDQIIGNFAGNYPQEKIRSRLNTDAVPINFGSGVYLINRKN